MAALLIRAATLEGAGEGILYFIRPQWEKLASADVSNQSFYILSGFLLLYICLKNKEPGRRTLNKYILF